MKPVIATRIAPHVNRLGHVACYTRISRASLLVMTVFGRNNQWSIMDSAIGSRSMTRHTERVMLEREFKFCAMRIVTV